MALILGRKIGMTQLFAEDGTATGCSVVAAGPCTVMHVRTKDRDGYDAVQLGFEDAPDRRVAKPQREAAKKVGAAPKRFLREERLEGPGPLGVGDTVTVGAFQVGDLVDVVGVTKGRGFAGTIKRWHFNRGPKTHGCMNYRQPGSIGSSADPARVFRGLRMSGHFGAKRLTTKNLEIVRIDGEQNLIFVRGAIPGPRGGFVQVRTARTGVKKG